MKKLLYVLVILFISFRLNAQIDIYAPTSDLTDTETETIADAKKDIDRGDRMTAAADNDFQKYANLFSGNKRKKKKAEAKTVPAKRNLLTAGNYFNTGYKKLYDLYTTKLSTIAFQFQDDKQAADKLVTEAEKLFNDGENILKSNKTYSDKQLKKTVKYQNLASNITSGAEKEKQAIEKLAEALALYENQTQKQQDLNAKDNQAWQDALMEDSKNAYETYIQNFPNGMHVTEANQKIQDINQKIADAQSKQNNPDIEYHVQIAASLVPLSDGKIKNSIYFTNEAIQNYQEDDSQGRHWYKYYIGTFSGYQEAHTYLGSMGRLKNRSKAFVIGFINGEHVAIDVAVSAEGLNPDDFR